LIEEAVRERWEHEVAEEGERQANLESARQDARQRAEEGLAAAKAARARGEI
jgi:hypothetical protein